MAEIVEEQPKVILTEENAGRVIAGLKIRKASALSLGIFMALYAQGGAGKTTLAAECYKLGKTLLIDAEGGSDVLEDLQNEENLDIVDVKTYKEFESVCDALKKDVKPYEYIIVDNLSELVDQCEYDRGIIGNDSHDLQRYNLVKKEIMKKVRFFRDLTRTRQVTVIICCWDADEKDDRGVLKKDLAFTPAIRKEYPGICTIIGHIDVTSDPDLRTLNFAPSPKTVSKFKRSRNSSAMQVPYKITYGINNLPLVDVLNTMKGLQSWPEKTYSKIAKEE